MTWLQGLDVSYAQSDSRTSASLLDWDQVRQAGIEVVYTKLSEGAHIRDSAAHNHIDGEVAAGIPHRLGYHFARLSASADANVNVFLERYDAVGEMEGAVLDFEDDHNPLDADASTEWALAWLGAVSAHVGRAPFFYTFSGYTSRFTGADELAAYPLILANYGTNNGVAPPTRTPPRTPAPWTSFTGWQHTSVGRLPGYGSNLDLNVFDADLFAAASPAPTPTPPPTPPTPELKNMDEKAIYDLLMDAHTKFQKEGAAVNAAKNTAAVLKLPREQWAGQIANLLTALIGG
jgi:GH25 family lysozyme M1 (1,4-beta-N-acetylmuramidase)